MTEHVPLSAKERQFIRSAVVSPSGLFLASRGAIWVERLLADLEAAEKRIEDLGAVQYGMEEGIAELQATIIQERTAAAGRMEMDRAEIARLRAQLEAAKGSVIQ